MTEQNSGPPIIKEPQEAQLSDQVEVTIVVIGKTKILRDTYTDHGNEKILNKDKILSNEEILKYEKEAPDMDLYEQLEGCDTLEKLVSVEDV